MYVRLWKSPNMAFFRPRVWSLTAKSRLPAGSRKKKKSRRGLSNRLRTSIPDSHWSSWGRWFLDPGSTWIRKWLCTRGLKGFVWSDMIGANEEPVMFVCPVPLWREYVLSMVHGGFEMSAEEKLRYEVNYCGGCDVCRDLLDNRGICAVRNPP